MFNPYTITGSRQSPIQFQNHADVDRLSGFNQGHAAPSTVNSDNFPILHRPTHVQVDARELQELTSNVVSLRGLIEDLTRQHRASEARLDARIGQLEQRRNESSMRRPDGLPPASEAQVELLPSVQANPQQLENQDQHDIPNCGRLPVKRRTPERNALKVNPKNVR